MSGSKTAYDSPHAQAMRKLANDINADLKRRGIYHWKTKYRIWADPSRGDNMDGSISAFGDNITDIDLFIVMNDGTLVPCFCIGGDNLHDPSVLIDMSMLNAVMDSLEGGNARMVEPDGTRISVTHVLKNLGTYFKHMGLAEDCDMLGNFKNCTLRFQVHVVELEVGQTLADMEEGQLMMYANNYHSRTNEAKNVNLLFTAQCVSICTDASGPGVPVPLYLQGKSEDDGKLHNYAIGVEATKRAFSQTGKQTMEEKIEQVDRGRSAEMKFIQHDDMPEMCSVLHLQVPCKKKPLKPHVINPADLVAAASSTLSPTIEALVEQATIATGIPLAPEPAVVVHIADTSDDFVMVGEEDSGVHYCSCTAPPFQEADDTEEVEEVPVMRSTGVPPATGGAANSEKYRSLPALRSSTSPARKMARRTPNPPPEETCRAASTHRGKDMGVCFGLDQTDLQPDDGGASGIPTATFSIFMVKPKGTPFGTDDVKNAIDLAEVARKCAGDAHVRNHKVMKDAGATTDGMSQSAAVEIAQTMKAIAHRARKSNVPLGVF